MKATTARIAGAGVAGALVAAVAMLVVSPTAPTTPQTLQTAAIRITDFEQLVGQDGDWSAAVQAAIHACDNANCGRVIAPYRAEPYLLIRHPRSNEWASIYVNGLAHPVTLEGEGYFDPQGEAHQLTTFLMSGVGNGADHSALQVWGGAPFTVRNLVLDGNGPAYVRAETDEQTHLVLVRHGADVTFDRVVFRRAYSDGAKLYGETDEPVSAAFVGCRFYDSGRSGITFQHNVDGVLVYRSTFLRASDQAIDSEPSGAGVDHVVLLRNHIDQTMVRGVPPELKGALAITLANGTGWHVADNTILGGEVFGQNVQYLTFARNVVRGGSRQGRHAIQVFRDSHHLLFEDCDISTDGGATASAISLQYNNGSAPHDVTISRNKLKGRSGVNITGGSSYVIVNNDIRDDSVRTGAGISVTTTAAGLPTDTVRLLGNTTHGFKYGIQVVASVANVTKLLRHGNTSDGFATAALRLQAQPGLTIQDLLP